MKKNQLIQTNPWDYSLHQLLSIIEKQHSHKAEFGCGKKPEDEAAQLKAYCSFSSPSSDCIEYKEENNKSSLKINHTSLVGINGILPQRYSEIILNKEKDKNFSIIDFLDIFHHRTFGLMHKIEKQTQLNLNRNPLANFQYCHAIAGSLPDKNEKTHKIFHKVFPSFAGFLWQKHKTASGLIQILNAIFPQLKITIAQFIPKWIEIFDENRAYLNKNPLKNKMLGKKAKCISNTIKIILETNDVQIYNQMLPDTENFTLIKKTAKYYLPAGFEAHIDLKLTQKNLSCKLDKTHKLGYNTWIGMCDGRITSHD